MSEHKKPRDWALIGEYSLVAAVAVIVYGGFFIVWVVTK